MEEIFFKCLTYISTIFATTCTAFAPIVRLAIFSLRWKQTVAISSSNMR